jgi:hypothetical protein
VAGQVGIQIGLLKFADHSLGYPSANGPIRRDAKVRHSQGEQSQDGDKGKRDNTNRNSHFDQAETESRSGAFHGANFFVLITLNL